jgi:hypothetical protein
MGQTTIDRGAVKGYDKLLECHRVCTITKQQDLDDKIHVIMDSQKDMEARCGNILDKLNESYKPQVETKPIERGDHQEPATSPTLIMNYEPTSPLP